jgi:hypothetical protein
MRGRGRRAVDKIQHSGVMCPGTVLSEGGKQAKRSNKLQGEENKFRNRDKCRNAMQKSDPSIRGREMARYANVCPMRQKEKGDRKVKYA